MSIQNITIKRVWIDPVEFVTASGEKFGSHKTNFITKEYGDERWISGFSKLDRANELKAKTEGDNEFVLEVQIKESEKLNSKTNLPFLNWKFVTDKVREEEELAELRKFKAQATAKKGK